MIEIRGSDIGKTSIPRGGWLIYDTRMDTPHWASDEAVDETVEYLQRHGWFKEKVRNA